MATGVLKEVLLRGYALHKRIDRFRVDFERGRDEEFAVGAGGAHVGQLFPALDVDDDVIRGSRW